MKIFNKRTLLLSLVALLSLLLLLLLSLLPLLFCIRRVGPGGEADLEM